MNEVEHASEVLFLILIDGYFFSALQPISQIVNAAPLFST